MNARSAPAIAALGLALGACAGSETPQESAAPADSVADTSDTSDTSEPSDTSDTAPAPDPLTVVVIVLDTARYDLFDEATMPRLYARRAEGRYVRVHASVAAWTMPTTITLMSGVRLEESGLDPQDHEFPVGSYVGLPRILHDEGWFTYLHTTNNVVSHNLADGFDEVATGAGDWGLAEQGAEVIARLDSAPTDRSRLVWMQPMNLHVPYDKLDASCEATAVAADATCPEAVIDATGNGSFTPGEFSALNKDETDACRAALEIAQRCAATRLDGELDSFIASLPTETLIVVTADHGEGWLDPRIEHNWGASAKLTRGFMLWLHPSLLGDVEPLASEADLAPSVLEFVGVDRPDLTFEGVPLGQPQVGPPTSYYCDEKGHLEIAAWNETHQLIRVSDPAAGVSWELYDLAADPTGDVNLADTTALPDALVAAAEAKASRTAWLCPAP